MGEKGAGEEKTELERACRQASRVEQSRYMYAEPINMQIREQENGCTFVMGLSVINSKYSPSRHASYIIDTPPFLFSFFQVEVMLLDSSSA